MKSVTKWLTTLFICLIACLCALGITGCDNESNNSSHTHNYMTVTVSPTCTEMGYTTYVCATCNYSYTDDPINPLGHLEVIHNAQAPTCTEIGWIEYTTCERCNYTTYQELSVRNHIYTNYVYNNDATCEQDGTKTATCIYGCGKKDTVTAVETAHGHSYNNYVYNNDATCEQDGTKTATCIYGCGKKDTVTAVETALGHTQDMHDAQTPTCTEIGWNEYETCERCKYTTYQELAALGHDYVNKKCIRCKTDYFSKGLSYTLSSDESYYSVSGLGSCEDLDVVIPATHNELPVANIVGGAFRNCTSLTEIVIPDSVISIGMSAFYNCSSLTELIIPNGVTSINLFTFYGCTSLTNIVIPDSVISIGAAAFEGCIGLTKIVIPNDVTDIGFSAFEDCSSLTEVTIPNSVTSIGNRAFAECRSLTRVTIGDGVTSIGRIVFGGCLSLTNITVSENNTTYTSIDGNLYSKDEALLIVYTQGKTKTDFTIPDRVTAIDERAFGGCRSLTRVTIGEGVTSIGNYAFEDCSSLTELVIPDSVTSIGTGAFDSCDRLKIATLPASAIRYVPRDYLESVNITSGAIEGGIFQFRSSLKNVLIGDGVTSIDISAFIACTDLTNITVSENNTTYTSIDGNLYSKDEAQLILYPPGKTKTDFTIPDHVTSIGNYAFRECRSLTELVISEGVTSIGEWAFYDCTSLTEIVIPNSVTSIGSSAFFNCTSLTEIVIPNSVTSIADYAFYNTGYYNNEKNWTDGVLYIGNYLIKAQNTLTTYIVKPDTILIANSAFYNCTSLTEIVIPDSVTSIGIAAFYNCTSLTEIVIPDSVTSIGISAFYNCTSLTEIAIPDSVTHIGIAAFKDCSSLTEIVIPDSVTSIGISAFYNCTSLTEIAIPDSVTHIGERAFEDCSSLTIYCEAESKPEGWVEKWNVSNRPVEWGYTGKN